MLKMVIYLSLHTQIKSNYIYNIFKLEIVKVKQNNIILKCKSN